jgi:hypothetical protein
MAQHFFTVFPSQKGYIGESNTLGFTRSLDTISSSLEAD